jgi:hypothetical protein
MMIGARGAIHVADTGATRGLPETDVRFDVVPGCLHGGPAFETEANTARVFAFLSAAQTPFGKASLGKAR